MKNPFTLILYFLSLVLFSCGKGQKPMETSKKPNDSLVLMTLDPGHFHASLIQKEMYPQVSPRVYVYAPDGPELSEHLNRISSYNTRSKNPTQWKEVVYTGKDYLEKMLKDKPGNVVVISGNNAKKTEYILKSVEAGIHVLADKPMVIFPEDFAALQDAFDQAKKNKVILYDIMTERFEITNLLQKELAAIPEVFGQLQKGSPDNPAIINESVHHFYKNVSGSPLIRPAWFFDISQQGEGLVDVTTHLVDLNQWECFPGKIIDYKKDVEMISASRWTTDLTLGEFSKVTGLDSYPDYLRKYVAGNLLKVYSNGEILYKIFGTCARVSVVWRYQEPETTEDTHFSIIRGSLASLLIRQGKEENYQPVLYVESTRPGKAFESALTNAVNKTLAGKYPGISLAKIKEGKWKVVIPGSYKVGHEAHFAQVAQNFLHYIQHGDMPDWEVPNTIAKYFITTEALRIAKSAK